MTIDSAGPAPALAPCSEMTRAAGDEPDGSAAAFTSFLLLDYRRPWGRAVADDMITDLLDADVAERVRAERGVRPFATRPVRDRRTAPAIGPRLGTVGANPTLHMLEAPPTASDLTALAAGSAPGEPIAGPVIGVCTNAKRDRCCAVRGRPIAASLHEVFGARVTEISHTSGHRFAATMVVLPSGYSYGFLDPESAERIVRAACDGLVAPDHLRGRADLDAPQQAADAYWRRGIGPAPLGDVTILSATDVTDPGGEPVTLVAARVQGTYDEVRVRRVPGPTITETVCSSKPIATGHWQVEAG